MGSVLAERTRGEIGKLYLTEECHNCGFKYGHAVEKDAEQSITISWHLRILKNQKGEVMRSDIDCPVCGSSNTQIVALNKKP